MSLRRARHVFATGLLALGAFAFSQQHADAAGNCSGQTMGNYFDGFAYNSSRQPATYFYGASAFIVVKRGVRCYNSPANTYNFIYTWTMIAADNVKANNPNNNGWAQVGPVYGYTSSSTPPQFQWLSQSYAQAGGGMLDNRISSFTIDDQIGTRHAFRAYLDRGICGCARMVIDSTIWAATSSILCSYGVLHSARSISAKRLSFPTTSQGQLTLTIPSRRWGSMMPMAKIR